MEYQTSPQPPSPTPSLYYPQYYSAHTTRITHIAHTRAHYAHTHCNTRIVSLLAQIVQGGNLVRASENRHGRLPGGRRGANDEARSLRAKLVKLIFAFHFVVAPTPEFLSAVTG